MRGSSDPLQLVEPIVHRVRVRYCETDRMGVAHHGSYIAWLEEARTEWMRARGASYRAMEDAGDLLQVVHVDLQYRSPVTYDDEVAIRVGLLEIRNASVTIGDELRAVAGDQLVAVARTTLACVGRDGKVKRLPDALRTRQS